MNTKVRSLWGSLYVLITLLQWQLFFCYSSSYHFKRFLIVGSLNGKDGYSDLVSKDKETFIFPLDILNDSERIKYMLMKMKILNEKLETKHIYQNLKYKFDKRSDSFLFTPKSFLFHPLGKGIFDFQNLLYGYCDNEGIFTSGSRVIELDLTKMLRSEIQFLHGSRTKTYKEQIHDAFNVPKNSISKVSMKEVERRIFNFGIMLILESLKYNQCESVIKTKKMENQHQLFNSVMDEVFIAFVQYFTIFFSGNVQTMIFKKNLNRIESEQTYDTIILPFELLTQPFHEVFPMIQKFLLRYLQRYLFHLFIYNGLEKTYKQKITLRVNKLAMHMIPCLKILTLDRSKLLLNKNLLQWPLSRLCTNSILEYSKPAKFVNTFESDAHLFLTKPHPSRFDVLFASKLPHHFPWFIILEWILNLTNTKGNTLSSMTLKMFRSYLPFQEYLDFIIQQYNRNFKKEKAKRQEFLKTKENPNRIQVVFLDPSTPTHPPITNQNFHKLKKNEEHHASSSNPLPDLGPAAIATTLLGRKASHSSISQVPPSNSNEVPNDRMLTDQELLYLISNFNDSPETPNAPSTSTEPSLDTQSSTPFQGSNSNAQLILRPITSIHPEPTSSNDSSHPSLSHQASRLSTKTTMSWDQTENKVSERSETRNDEDMYETPSTVNSYPEDDATPNPSTTDSSSNPWQGALSPIQRYTEATSTMGSLHFFSSSSKLPPSSIVPTLSYTPTSSSTSKLTVPPLRLLTINPEDIVIDSTELRPFTLKDSIENEWPLMSPVLPPKVQSKSLNRKRLLKEPHDAELKAPEVVKQRKLEGQPLYAWNDIPTSFSKPLFPPPLLPSTSTNHLRSSEPMLDTNEPEPTEFSIDEVNDLFNMESNDATGVETLDILDDEMNENLDYILFDEGQTQEFNLVQEILSDFE